jgi:hypothetical protein
MWIADMDTHFAMIPLAAIADNRLTLRMLKTFAAICSFRKSADDFSVQAGRDEIAKHCGLHPSIISTATTELERIGWLEKKGIGGRSMKTTYRITPPETVAQSETVTDSETVSNSVTVTESETVTESVSKTVTDSATPLYKKEVNTKGVFTKSKDSAPEGFADCWSAYPKREGGNSRADALKAFRGRIKSGASPIDLLAGTKRYAAHCAVKGIVGTAYVMQAARFFGPGDHWQESWGVSSAGAAQDQKPKAGDTRARHGINETFNEVAGWVPA